MIPAVRLTGPNESCFVSSTFAVIRQTQNSVPKSINNTLTFLLFSCSIIILVLLKGVRPRLGFASTPTAESNQTCLNCRGHWYSWIPSKSTPTAESNQTCLNCRGHWYSWIPSISTPAICGCKGNANRAKYKTKTHFFVFIYETQPTLTKGQRLCKSSECKRRSSLKTQPHDCL